jgi:hypothetical protein
MSTGRTQDGSHLLLNTENKTGKEKKTIQQILCKQTTNKHLITELKTKSGPHSQKRKDL